MCVPSAILAAVSAFAANQWLGQDYTPQIPRNTPPPIKPPGPAATGPLDPEKLRKDDEDITLSSTSKQRKDRKRAREGLKTLSAVDPAYESLPSSPDQGITV
jgi:hypothetical protein